MDKPVFDECGKWSKGNIYFTLAVMGEMYLSGMQLAILSYIVDSYNRECFRQSYKENPKNVECEMSYSDLAEKLRCDVSTIRKSLGHLVELKLLNRVGRKGRTSYRYIPNELELNAILKRYLEEIPSDAEE